MSCLANNSVNNERSVALFKNAAAHEGNASEKSRSRGKVRVCVCETVYIEGDIRIPADSRGYYESAGDNLVCAHMINDLRRGCFLHLTVTL